MKEANNPNLSNTEKIGKNLKPFNLEAAKAGKPVCTRDGRKARIICFDMMNPYSKPIAAFIRDKKFPQIEDFTIYHKDGRYSEKKQSGLDLVMASETHEGWINIYLDTDRNMPYCCEWIFPTKENAEKYDGSADRKIATVKITWEEE